MSYVEDEGSEVLRTGLSSTVSFLKT